MAPFSGMPFPVQFVLAFVAALALIGAIGLAARSIIGKPTKPKGVLIARLEGERRSPVLSTPYVFLVLGFIAMLVEIVLESSAIRLAAYGAIWTGWNVLCGIGVLSERRTDYVVYREISPERIEPWL